MGWSEAYNFNIDESISISKAISLREKKDPRAGDLHCHKSCYLSKEGSRLLTRKASIDNKTGKVKNMNESCNDVCYNDYHLSEQIGVNAQFSYNDGSEKCVKCFPVEDICHGISYSNKDVDVCIAGIHLQ